jgi:hypothetical protein
MKNRKITDTLYVTLTRVASKPGVVNSRYGKVWLAGLTALVMTACASMPGSGPQGLVKQRAAERWSALVSGEFIRAYSYNTPGFRAVVTPDGFRNRFGGAVKWVGSEVVKVDCPDAVKCTVTMRVDFKPVVSGKAGGDVSTHVDETWLLEDGQWWFFQPLQGS